MMNIASQNQPSKFQIHNEIVLRFLEQQRNQPDEVKLIYPHQIEALFAVKEYFSAIQTPDHPALVVAPTGSGKSGIVALLPYVLASPKVMILSPSKIITEQLEKEFGMRQDVVEESFYFQRGMVALSNLNDFLEIGNTIYQTEAIRNMKRHNLIIVNAQKFGTNSAASLDEAAGDAVIITKENVAAFTTLIVDEAHHYPADTWDLICREFMGKQIIFLTATPFRGSGRKKLWEGQEITYKISKRRLIEMKVIRPLRYVDIDCPKITEWTEMPREIIEFIGQTLAEHDNLEPSVQHKAMVLVNKKRHAESGSNAIEGATYYTSDPNTQRNLRRFENNNPDPRILCVCGKLLEGYDNPSVSLCVILRKVGCLGTFTQFVGRCVRMSNRTDPVTAVVASFPTYKQKRNFNDYHCLD